MEDIKLIELDEVDSTNRFLREYSGEEGRDMTIALAGHQTAGRGQGSNTWESEKDKNLLFSIKIYPKGINASNQFVIQEAGALALAAALSDYVEGITVKWPNDIYWNDKKISGTLSECDICKGLVSRCIIGIGVNINQQKFISDAPNPTSLAIVLGHEVDKKHVFNLFTSYFYKYQRLLNSGHYDDIHNEYLSKLYRKSGFHEFEDKNGRFFASIETVEPCGLLVLRKENNTCSKYAFKEVSYIIK